MTACIQTCDVLKVMVKVTGPDNHNFYRKATTVKPTSSDVNNRNG